MPVVCLLGALALAGCGGGGHKAPRTVTTNNRSVTTGRATPATHRVSIALHGAQEVSETLPAAPLATEGTTLPGLDLEAWSLQREGDAVTVIVGLHNVGTKTITDQHINQPVIDFESALDVNGGKDPTAFFNSAALLDTSSLEEYETYAQVRGGDVEDCLCSSVGDINLAPGARMYLAAVTAAPPAATTHVTLITGVGSFADLPLSG